MRNSRFHTSLCFLAFVTLIISGSARRAGALPLDDDKKAGVRFVDGSPSAEKNPNGGWKVTAKAKYRYDTGWEFSEMRMLVYFVKKGDKEPKASIESTWPKGSIGTPGEVAATYNTRAPGEGETVLIKSVMVAKHPIFGEQEWSISSPVLPPVKK